MDFPFALTEANLRRAMADRRYADRRHPQSAVWRGMVAKGWATLYPDELLRGDHTDVLPRHLGADGAINASDGTRVGTAPGGRVQVRGYVRYVNGQPVQVNGYDRDVPEGSGGGGAGTLAQTADAPLSGEPRPRSTLVASDGAGEQVAEVPPSPAPPVAQQGVDELQAKAQANGGFLSSGADKGSKECVALVKAAVPELGPTKEWKKGEAVDPANPDLQRGTPIAKGWDKDGNYPSNSTGNHTAIYGGPDEKNPGHVKILEQWAERNGRVVRKAQPARITTISAEKAKAYNVIRRK